MMRFRKNGKQIVFDDYVNEVEEYNSYYVEMCEKCRKEYQDILEEKVDFGSAQGICSVDGCWNYADHYVDFDPAEVDFYE